VVFQDSSELILCSGNGQVTFVNAKGSSVKRVPLCSTPGSNMNLEIEEPSLFKRLQYAKEILMQMVSSTDKHTREGCSSSSLAAVIQGCCQANGRKRDNSNSNATSKNTMSRSGYSSTLSGMEVAPS